MSNLADPSSTADATPVPDALGSAAVLLAAALWGTSGVFVKLIAAGVEVSALSLAFWRDLCTFLLLASGLALFRRPWLRVDRSDIKWLALLGGSLGSFHVFWNLAVFLNGAAVATVQQAAMPAIVALVAWAVWREPLTWRKIAAIMMTFAGTVFVSGLDVLGQAELSLGGLLVGIALAATYAAWNLFGKKIRSAYNPFTMLCYGFGFGALVLLPLQFFTPQPWPVPASVLPYFSGLLIVSTILSFSIYIWGLGRLQASVATILVMSEIAFVAVYAYLLLDESLSASQVFGAVLVVAGVLLLSWRRRRRLTRAPDASDGGATPRLAK